MTTFTITGQLLDSKQHPLSGFKVVAFDKNKKVSDYLGTAYTDVKGQFTITFGKERFFDGIEDNLPDVFFLVYQGDRVIYSTENRPIKNLKELDNVILTIDIGEGNLATIYTLHGEVRQKKIKVPFSDLKVEAWEKDKKISDQLGLAITDKKGQFSIQYDISRFRDDPTDDLPDVFFRIYIGDEMLHSTEGKPIKNVKCQKGIIIEIEYSPDSFEIPIPNLPKAIVLNIFENIENTPVSLQNERPDVYAAIVQKARRELQRTTAAFFKKASYNLKYFAKKMDFASLTKEDGSAKDYIEEKIEISHLPISAKNEARSRLTKWVGPETLGNIILPDIPIKKNPIFQPELQQAEIFKIAEMASLNDNIAERLISKGISLYNIGPESVKKLVDDKVITKTQGETLNLNANVYALSNGNIRLSNAIKNVTGNKALGSLSELASLEVADWKNILQSAQLEGDEEAIEKQARIKQKQIEILYPHPVFKARSKKAELQTVLGLMNKFYSSNEDLNFLHLDYSIDSEDLKKVRLDNFSESEKKMIFKNLKTNQRLYKVTKDATDTFKLKKAGYYSGNGIIRGGYYRFLKTSGLDDYIAKRYYRYAEQISLNLSISIANITDTINNPLI